MRVKKAKPLKTLLAILGLLFAIFLLLSWYQKTNLNSVLIKSAPAIKFLPSSSSVLQNSEMHSSDGTKTLILRVTSTSNESQVYSFFTRDLPDGVEKQLFSKEINASDSFELPFNTWSPDNKYVFLQQNSPAGKHTLVLKASGELFPGGEQYYDAVTLSVEKKLPYIFDTATGWASETLLVFTTKKEDGAAGPNYWFEVPSKAFIQLSH